MSINKHSDPYFDPETIEILQSALERAVDALPANERTANARARLAARILALANTGERDPRVLERRAGIHIDQNPGSE